MILFPDMWSIEVKEYHQCVKLANNHNRENYTNVWITIVAESRNTTTVIMTICCRLLWSLTSAIFSFGSVPPQTSTTGGLLNQTGDIEEASLPVMITSTSSTRRYTHNWTSIVAFICRFEPEDWVQIDTSHMVLTNTVGAHYAPLVYLSPSFDIWFRLNRPWGLCLAPCANTIVIFAMTHGKW